jgi:hypothetical protein
MALTKAIALGSSPGEDLFGPIPFFPILKDVFRVYRNPATVLSLKYLIYFE